MTLTPPSSARFKILRLGLVALLVWAALVSPTSAREVSKGLVVSVAQNEIGDLARRLPALLETPLKLFEQHGDAGAGPFHLVCDFNPGDKPNSSTSFGSCYDLAKQIERLRKDKSVYVVAFVHGKVSKHSVLPVLACTQIVMSDSAPSRLGPIAERNETLEPLEKENYQKIASGRFSPVLIRKMFEPNLRVYKVKPFVKEGDTYRDAGTPDLPPGDLVDWLGKGIVIEYDFDKAKQVQLVQPEPHNTLEDVLRSYGLTRRALFQQPEKLVVVRTTLSGKVSPEMREVLERRIDRAKELGANVLILELECGEGNVGAAYEMALALIELGQREENRVETIAYVTPSARNLATFLALACDRIYIHPEALLGDFEPFVAEREDQLEVLRRNLADVAREKHYPEVIARGMLDRDLQVQWVESFRGKSEKRFMDGATFKEAQAKDDRWRIIETVKSADGREFLTLDAKKALRFGIAAGIQENVEGVYDRLGVKASEVEVIAGDFLEKLASFLRDPMTSMVLIVLGITCLIIELKMPGVGIPGIISAVCFVLYFWAHSHFHGGTMMWLALLLFLLGLLLLAAEIFVIPGFGVVGVAGIILVMGALGLMAFGHWPRTEEDWVSFTMRIGSIMLGMCVAVVLAIVAVRYIPNMPIANRLILNPPEEEELDDELDFEGEEQLQLLGAIGVSATPLRPAGKTQIGDDFLDVVAEGGYIAAGTRVQIVAIEGNRIVVKEL